VGIKSFTQQAFQPFSMAMFETSDPIAEFQTPRFF